MSCEADELLDLADGIDIFATPEGTAYAGVPVDGHHEIGPVRSDVFEMWLRNRYYSTVRRVPRAASLRDAVATIEARAHFEGPRRQVFTRVAAAGQKVYLDLCDSQWRVVEIDPDGWRVVEQPPVSFRRSSGMRALPEPVEGGQITDLRAFVNPGIDENSWRLIVGWLLGALNPWGPYPVLLLHGEQGSGKSHLTRVLRALVDPSVSPVRTAPPSERDLIISAQHSWLVALDNLSGVPPRLSDALCRLATGGGLSMRRLYTDSQEVVFQAMRPVLLNGIDDMTDRHDLADRAIVLHLPSIADSERQTESAMWEEFHRAAPGILGSLCTGLSAALRRKASVDVPGKPRMADFAVWVSAAEQALGWEDGAFFDAYARNRAETVELALEYDLVVSALRSLLARQRLWIGTATELVSALDSMVSDRTRASRAWPVGARALSASLRRAATALRAVGIHIRFKREARGRRVISLECIDRAVMILDDRTSAA